ncbi:MAG: DUF3995 domain-containing protein, partial [Acidimicrobiia bacterium]|nr:DUF3995 domain-containing protein [Acidimicrobiia bacterium]
MGGPPRAWTGCASAGWALAFAGLSFYWAAGGRLGLGTLALALRDKTLAREQGFVALLWFTGALKVLVALLAFALVRRGERCCPAGCCSVPGGPLVWPWPGTAHWASSTVSRPSGCSTARRRQCRPLVLRALGSDLASRWSADAGDGADGRC